MDVLLSELFQGESVSLAGPDVEIRSLAYDSRRVGPGALFGALRGQKADGHAHIAAAIARGAAAVLCERPAAGPRVTFVRTDNARRALARAARRFFGDPSQQLTTVGVTGTNGKTTTVHLLESIFAAAGSRPAILGTLGSRFAGQEIETGMTTPESTDLLELLARMVAAGCRSLAMEVSSHALAQERVAGVDFDVGLFTNLTHDHLDYHGTLDDYFAAKRRLFAERLKPAGRAVVNLDDDRGAALAALLPAARVWGFSLGRRSLPGCRVWPESLTLDRAGMTAVLSKDGRPLVLRSQLLGRFNAENVLGAVTAAAALDIPDEAIAAGVAALGGVPGRLERVSAAEGPLVLVDYAHSPDALTKALSTVREITAGRVICVFGCGGDRDAEKRPVMGRTVATLADWSVLTSDNPRSEDPVAILQSVEAGMVAAGAQKLPRPSGRGFWVDVDRAKAIVLAIGAAGLRDTVLIAGKGHETYQQIGSTRLPFDDRAHARAALDAAGFSSATAATQPPSEG